MSPRAAAQGGRRASLTREAVIEAALACVAAEGPGALGINRVARALGIRPPSLYNHVRSGDDLKRAVAVAGWRRLGARFAEAVDDPDPARALVTVAERFRAFVVAEPALYQLMSQTKVPRDDPEFAEVERAILGTFAGALAPLGLTGDEVVHATRALRAATHGFVLLEAAGQLGLPQDPEESYRKLVGWLIAGLGAGARDPA